MVIFQIPLFSTFISWYSIVGESFPFSPFISVESKGFLCYLMGYDLLLSLFILMVKLNQLRSVWLLQADFCVLLTCLCHFFQPFFTFWNSVLGLLCTYSSSTISPRKPASFKWRMAFTSQDLAVGVLSGLGVCLLSERLIM